MHFTKKLSALWLMIAMVCVVGSVRAAESGNPMTAYTEMMSQLMGGMPSGHASGGVPMPAYPMGMANPTTNPLGMAGTMINPMSMVNPMTMANPMMNPLGAMLNPMMIYPMMMAPMMMPMTGMMNPMMSMTSPMGPLNPTMTHPGAMVPYFNQSAPASHMNFMDQFMKQMQEMAPKPEKK